MKRRSPSQLSETRSRIERWFAEMDYTTEVIVREELTWGLGAQKENTPGIAAAQMTRYTDRVFLQVAYVLEDELKERLASLDADERARLLWDIRFLLITMNAPFDGIADPLTTVSFLDSIFIEALNRTLFAEKTFNIHRSYIALSWFFQRRFPDVKIEEKNYGTGSTFIN